MKEVSVVISTKNRRADLDKCLASLRPFVEDCEVIVADDGSTDGTSDLVVSKYPEVELIRHEVSAGYIVRRNELVAKAKGHYVMFIDDDAAVQDGSFVPAIICAFGDAKVQAVALPYVDVLYGPKIRQHTTDAATRVVAYFRGTAGAVRRDFFMKCGGFPEILQHQYEETAFCTKIYGAGGYVVVADATPLLHYESPIRSVKRIHYHNARNALIYYTLLLPFPYILTYSIGGIIKGPFRGGLSHFGPALRGTVAGCFALFAAYRLRSPIPKNVFAEFQTLRRTGTRTLEDWTNATQS